MLTLVAGVLLAFGGFNISIGDHASQNSTSASHNICIGDYACPDVTSASHLTCIGPRACEGVTTQNGVVDYRCGDLKKDPGCRRWVRDFIPWAIFKAHKSEKPNPSEYGILIT